MGAVAILGSLVASLITPLTGVSSASPISQCPWLGEILHHSAPTSHIANEIVSRMTPSELANFVVLQASTAVENFNVGVTRLCVPALTLVDGPTGVGNGATGVTQFPSEIALASTFNPTVVKSVGVAMGAEARTKGFDVLQGPDLNLIRTPLSGRAFETFGEDPLLASVLGVAVIEGIQSQGVMAQAKHLGAYTQENGRARLNQAVSSRVLSEVYNAPFLAAVEQAHVASVMCAMGSVNGVNTCSSPWLYSTLASWGFTGFTRSDYAAVTVPGPAFAAGMSLLKPATAAQVLSAVSSKATTLAALRRGVVEIINRMIAYGFLTHPRALTLASTASSPAHLSVALQAARQGVVLLKNSGNVLPLSPTQSVAVIGVDASNSFVSRGGGSSGVVATSLETPWSALRHALPHAHLTYSPGGPSSLEFDPLAATDVTAGIIPLKEVPIISTGPPGKGDVEVDLSKAVTLRALTASQPGTGEGWNNCDVTFTARQSGTYVLGLTDEGDTWLTLNGATVMADRGIHGPYPLSTPVTLVKGRSYTLKATWFAATANAEPRFGIDFVHPQIDAAVTAARHASVAVVFASNLLTEGADMPALELQSDLNPLISAVAKANPRTVVVLNTGGPIDTPWRNQVAGLVEGWYGGVEGATALAQVLSGQIDPSGRLPVSFPNLSTNVPASSSAQFPGEAGTVSFDGLSSLGYRWYQANGVTPAYPFGYGLSYTHFAWSKVSIVKSASTVTVSLTDTNNGTRAGHDVVQVYVAYPHTLSEPPEQLRGWGSVTLAPGHSARVRITLPSSAFTSDPAGRLRVVPGTYVVSVGESAGALTTNVPVTW